VSEHRPDRPQQQDPLAEPYWATSDRLTLPDPLADPVWPADLLAEPGWQQPGEPPTRQPYLPPRPKADRPAPSQPARPRVQPPGPQQRRAWAYQDLLASPSASRRGRPKRTVPAAAASLALLAALGIAAAVLVLHGRHPAAVVTARPAPVTSSAAPAPATGAETAPEITPASDEPGSPVVGEIRPGDCLNTHNAQRGFLRLPCSQPHDEEVFARRDLGDGDWPGESVVSDRAQTFCYAAVGSFIGVPADWTALTVIRYQPGESGWRDGDHTIACSIADPNGKTRGTLRGSRR
jgi:Septum formation